MKKRILTAALAAILLLSLAVPALAKTTESAKAENVFFYATNADGKAVLLKVIPLSDLKKISHGQASGDNYYVSSTDNYPTTQYCEARGITVPELVDFVKKNTSVSGASALAFSGGDTIRLMATDSFGAYNRSWTYSELYGAERYYFEGLFDASKGWKTGWEIAGEDSSKFGVSLDEYNAKYKANDPFYADKRAVFASGVKTVPILATESYSGRTTADALSASTEPGIADYIAKNGGTVAGSLKNVLSDETALRLSLPMTEADLMAAHRTSFDNFKWTYNIKLDMAQKPAIKSLGTVAEAVANVTVSGNTLTITLTCETSGAAIYYSFDGAPQTLYTAPVKIDITNRDLAANPITFYTAAVKEGYDDAGIVTYKYPGLAPAFKTQYSALSGSPVVFSAADGVSQQTWNDWASKLNYVTIKTPSSAGYVRVDAAKYKADNAAKTITFDASLFTETGAYGFVFHATGFADKSASLTVKSGKVDIINPKYAYVGVPLVFRFDDPDYQTGLTVYVTPPNGTSVMIPTNNLDRSVSGRVTVKAVYFESASCAIKAAGTYKFTFVNSRYEPGTVEVQLKIESGELIILDDIKSDAWYCDAVRFVTALKLFDLTGEKTFAPDSPTTRAVMVTALYRLAGSPSVTVGSDFDDVEKNTPLYAAVSWAAAAGITNGTGGNKYSPDVIVDREQMATYFYRFAQYLDADVSAKGDLTKFPDRGDISDWALDAVTWANGAGVINGMGDGAGGLTMSPKYLLSRAMIAQLFYNWAA